MNVIERLTAIDADRKISDFKVKQQQPYVSGEAAWNTKDCMKNIIESRKGTQLSFFTL